MSFLHNLCLSSPLILFIFVSYLNFTLLQALALTPTPEPVPATWPEQFHSVQFMNNSKGQLQKTDLWYDWPNRRNFNIIQNQLGKLIYDLEWGNGTSFIYTLDDSNHECRVMHFPVGILGPNWLDGAKYLGQKYMDGFLCNVWVKVDFLWYYEDVYTKRPVYWRFFNGLVTHVITFEVGKVLDDPNWQAPAYCFQDEIKKTTIASFHSHFNEGGEDHEKRIPTICNLMSYAIVANLQKLEKIW